MKNTTEIRARRLRWLPNFFRGPLVAVRNSLVVFAERIQQVNLRRVRRRELENALKNLSPIKIIVGANETSLEGWVSTNKDTLNLLVEQDWANYFKHASIDALFAEHVWEHLTWEDGGKACRNCFEYLKQGGLLRIAVPDGFHVDPDYIDQVKPGGSGYCADDHQVLFNYQSLSDLLESAGFEVRLLEWFDEHGNFHHEDWNPEDGFVKRSTRFDARNKDNRTKYTSLIIDARKP